ncbi:hypothetical protein BGZ80_003913, partial [Entomortierella chlamydospora]
MTSVIKLFCILNGDSSSFSVTIPLDASVGDLKDAVKEKKNPRSDDYAADELALFQISVLSSRKRQIILSNYTKELDDPTSDISEVFGTAPAKRTIHVIVQRPSADTTISHPAVPSPLSPISRTTSPSATPFSSIFIPQGKIEVELVDILKGINYNHVRTAHPKEVEASQREKLGRFYKRPLPYNETAEDISLVMLELELDKQAKTSEGETLREIIDSDVGKYNDHRVVAMVAPSGSGKTATVVDLASRHFVIYAVCCIPSPTVSPGFKDPNFMNLSKDVESIYAGIINGELGSTRDPVDINNEVKSLVGDRVDVEFLARLLFLQHLLWCIA